MHAQNILTNTHCVDADIVEDMRILAVENNSTADYRPFPSKIFFLLYLLTYSSRPIVSTLIFIPHLTILFTYKYVGRGKSKICNIHAETARHGSTESRTTQELCTPKFLASRAGIINGVTHVLIKVTVLYSQHLTGSGVPFYVNSIANVISQCMGNATIAAQLARYPVLTDGPYT